jgi:CPA2 family monovalent cation:H+ antiporter-2
VGQSLASFALHDVKVRVLSLRHSNGKSTEALASTLLKESDTLVLSGKAEALALAEQRLLTGLNSMRAQSASSQ